MKSTFFLPAVLASLHAVAQAYHDVLARVVANKPVRDAVDIGLLREVATNIERYMNSRAE